MTTYWKSQSKHFCKLCNVWMSDNKFSIRHHEQGKKHQDLIRETDKQKRDSKIKESQDERLLRDELKNMERQASAVQLSDAQYFQNSSLQDKAESYKFVPPPPPPTTQTKEKYVLEEDDIVNPEEEDSGVYQVGDHWYLDGKKHEDKLVQNANCQIFIEGGISSGQGEIEEWIDGLILEVSFISVPNTNLKLRRHTIAYFVPGAETETVVKDVSSDKLRLLKSKTEEKAIIQKASISMDENTGIGQWQTVSIKKVTHEEAEKQRKSLEAKQIAKEMRNATAKAKLEREKQLEEDLNADDALGSSYALHHITGMYKGVDLRNIDSNTVSSNVIVGDRQEGESVDIGFKKRKGTTLNKDRFRRKHADEDEHNI